MTRINIREAFSGAVLLIFALLQSSCYYPESKPGWEYMPDMANAISYETYGENTVFEDSMNARRPVTGTIPRGVYEPFHFSPTTAGYDSAGLLLKFPAWVGNEDLDQGQYYFEIYCAPCHGTGGKGNGSIVENPNIKNPYPPPPSYFASQLVNLPEGKMYHSIHYGKNLMGAYSKQLNQHQVWQVIYYVKSLQTRYLDSVAKAAGPVADSAAAPASVAMTHSSIQ